MPPRGEHPFYGLAQHSILMETDETGIVLYFLDAADYFKPDIGDALLDGREAERG